MLDASEPQGEKKEEKIVEVEESEHEKLKKSLEEERERANEYLTQLKYLQADFENYRKKVKKDVEEAVKFGNERLVLKFLDVLDSLELAIEAGRKTSDKDALIKGVELTLKDLEEVLREEGLIKIEALGKPFDPHLHEAIATTPTSNSPDNIVVEELRKGYLLKGRMVRPSMVKVTKTILEKPSQLNSVTGEVSRDD